MSSKRLCGKPAPEPAARRLCVAGACPFVETIGGADTEEESKNADAEDVDGEDVEDSEDVDGEDAEDSDGSEDSEDGEDSDGDDAFNADSGDAEVSMQTALTEFLLAHNRFPNPGEKQVEPATVFASPVDLAEWCARHTLVSRKEGPAEPGLDRADPVSGRKMYRIVEQRLRWQRMYNAVEQYVQLHDKLPAKKANQDCVRDSSGLGKWCTMQRYSRHNLSAEQQEMLEKLVNRAGCSVWFWNLDEKWHAIYKEVALYTKQNDQLPAQRLRVDCGIAGVVVLSGWCAGQRKIRGKLSAERRSLLEQLVNRAGRSVWFWDLDEKWRAIYKEVALYAKQNNRLPARRLRVDCGIAGVMDLGEWCFKQRKRRNKMSAERRSLLEQLVGRADRPVWFWDLDEKWRAVYKEVALYTKQNNRLPAQRLQTDSGIAGVKNLGEWCLNQRKLRNKLSPEQQSLLEQLVDRAGRPVWFWDFDEKWRAIYKEVAKHAQNKGTIPSRKLRLRADCGIAGVIDLGVWCEAQRVNLSRNKLSAARREMFEKLVAALADSGSPRV